MDRSIFYAHMGDDPFVRVIFRVEDQGARGTADITRGSRHPLDNSVQDLFSAGAVFGGDVENLVFAEPECLLNLGGDPLRLSLGQVYLVHYRDEVQVVFHGQQGVGDGLGFDALAGVNHQQSALAGGQRAGDLVAEIHVAWCVDEIELVYLAIGAGVRHGHRFPLDGDSLLPFQVHAIQELRFHIAGTDRACDLQKPVGQGRFPMVDVGDDAEVSYQARFHTNPMVSRSIFAYNGDSTASGQQRPPTPVEPGKKREAV